MRQAVLAIISIIMAVVMILICVKGPLPMGETTREVELSSIYDIRHLQLMTDSKGDHHLMWTSQWDMNYLRIDDEGVQLEYQTDITGEESGPSGMLAVIDPRDMIHVLWEDYRHGIFSTAGLYYMRYDTNGDRHVEPTQVGGGSLDDVRELIVMNEGQYLSFLSDPSSYAPSVHILDNMGNLVKKDYITDNTYLNDSFYQELDYPWNGVRNAMMNRTLGYDVHGASSFRVSPDGSLHRLITSRGQMYHDKYDLKGELLHRKPSGLDDSSSSNVVADPEGRFHYFKEVSEGFHHYVVIENDGTVITNASYEGPGLVDVDPWHSARMTLSDDGTVNLAVTTEYFVKGEMWWDTPQKEKDGIYFAQLNVEGDLKREPERLLVTETIPATTFDTGIAMPLMMVLASSVVVIGISMEVKQRAKNEKEPPAKDRQNGTKD